MPLVSRDPGGWMSPKNAPKEAVASQPVLTARELPTAHPTVPITDPSMPYGRTSLVGLT